MFIKIKYARIIIIISPNGFEIVKSIKFLPLFIAGDISAR